MERQLVAAARRLPVERRFEQHRLHRRLEIQAYACLVPQRGAALSGGAAERQRGRGAELQVKGVAS